MLVTKVGMLVTKVRVSVTKVRECSLLGLGCVSY